MSKPKPPKPANDHLAVFGGRDDLETLTDEELDARLQASRIAQRRAFKLMLLRITEKTVAEMNGQEQERGD